MEQVSLLNNILNIYHDEKYNYDNLYRYVHLEEFIDLIENRRIRFTRPTAWKTTDEFETYFEEWWLDESHLIVWLEAFIEKHAKIASTLSLDITPIIPLLTTTFVNIISELVKYSYSYCLTQDYQTSEEEHHKKWSKNILLCFKKDFWKKLSLFNIKRYFEGDYLYADIFPMYYIDSFDDYIKEVLGTFSRDEMIDKVLNKGAFLKYSKYKDEKEVRISLSYRFVETCDEIEMKDKILSTISLSKNNEELIASILNYLYLSIQIYSEKTAKLCGLENDDYFYLNLQEELTLNEIVESIKISKDINANDKNILIEFAKKSKIPFEENAF